MDERDLEAHVGVESERAFFAGFAGTALMIVWMRASWLFGFPWPADAGSLRPPPHRHPSPQAA